MKMVVSRSAALSDSCTGEGDTPECGDKGTLGEEPCVWGGASQTLTSLTAALLPLFSARPHPPSHTAHAHLQL